MLLRLVSYQEGCSGGLLTCNFIVLQYYIFELHVLFRLFILSLIFHALDDNERREIGLLRTSDTLIAGWMAKGCM